MKQLLAFFILLIPAAASATTYEYEMSPDKTVVLDVYNYSWPRADSFYRMTQSTGGSVKLALDPDAMTLSLQACFEGIEMAEGNIFAGYDGYRVFTFDSMTIDYEPDDFRLESFDAATGNFLVRDEAFIFGTFSFDGAADFGTIDRVQNGDVGFSFRDGRFFACLAG